MMWCAAFGALHVIWIQFFTATVVPSVSGMDTPEAAAVVINIVSGIVLLAIGGFAGHLSDHTRPSVVVGRYAKTKRLLLLALAVLALARAILGLGDMMDGNATVVQILAEAWFTIAGVAGLGLCAALWGREQNLRRQSAASRTAKGVG